MLGFMAWRDENEILGFRGTWTPKVCDIKALACCEGQRK